MKAEQRYDLVAEADWQLCVQPDETLSTMMNGFCRHRYSGENDILAHHYDATSGHVIEVARIYGVMWNDGYHWGDS